MFEMCCSNSSRQQQQQQQSVKRVVAERPQERVVAAGIVRFRAVFSAAKVDPSISISRLSRLRDGRLLLPYGASYIIIAKHISSAFFIDD